MNLYIRKGIDIDDLCRGWDDLDYCYRLTDGMGEIIEVYKQERVIVNYGYTGLIGDWYNRNMLIDHKEDDSIMVFPHTIGNITFYNATELTEFILSRQ